MKIDLFKRILQLLVVVIVASSTQEAVAGETSTLLSRVLNGSTIKPGHWHKDFYKAKAYADNNGMPFVAVWSNGDACPHCVRFENCVNTTYFKQWEVKSGIVFWFGCPSNGYKTYNPEYPYQWAKGYEDRQKYTNGDAQTAFPFVRVWWKKGKVDVVRKGDDTHGGYDVYNTAGAKKLVANLEKWLKAYNPAKYTGGAFNFHDVDGDRLEIETGLTTNVVIDLVRTSNTGVMSTNYLQVVGGGTNFTEKLIWEGGDKSLTYNLPVDKDGEGNYTLYLKDAAKKNVATNHITRVAASNSPANPYFVGERENLGFGEWTMDLDAVTNLVATVNAVPGGGMSATADTKARALVLFGGALWCPDCVKTDEYFINTDAFKNWAKDNKIALAVLDVPNLPNETTSPCLLTKVSVANDTTKGYYKETKRKRSSGVSYLSRHMVDDATAATVYARNKKLASNNTLHGGWNRPERSNQSRPGVPTLVFLREDGTLGGRFQTFAFTSPTNSDSVDSYLKRLDELLEQEDLADEETNDYFLTTGLEIGRRDSKSGSVSHCDATDSYKLADDTKGLRLQATLSGTTDATVKLQVIRTSGTSSTEIGAATGKLTDGVKVEVDLPDSVDCYVNVITADSAGYFSVASASSTVAEYTLATDFVAVPEQVEREVAAEDGTLLVAVEEGEKYTFDGVTAASLNEHFTPLDEQTAAGQAIYVAKATGNVQLVAEGESIKMRNWVVGTVGFALTSATVAESSEKYLIEVSREGGVSGTATAIVKFESMLPAGLETDTIFTNYWDAATGYELTWEEGDDAAKRLPVSIMDNNFSDGTVRLTFSCTKGGDANEGTSQFVLTIKDNDKAVPGKLAIVDGDVKFAKDMTLVAKENTAVVFGVARKDGADGQFAATLAATAGTLDVEDVAWDKRHAETKGVTLTLPSVSTAKKSVVTLTAADSATKIDTSAKKLTVLILPESAPEFEAAHATIQGYSNVALAETRIKANGTDASKLKVAKYSGSLPDGVSWKFDKESSELVVYGAPKKASSKTAVFQVSEGSQAGLTVSVTVKVSDPAKEGKSVSGEEIVPNAFAASAHTYGDIMVVDEAEKRLAGLLTLTLPANGKASAKYRTAGGAVSLSAKCWDAESDPLTGLLKVTLKGTTAATSGYTLVVTIDVDGDVWLDFTDPNGEEIPVEEVGMNWSKSMPATAYKGYYTVSLPGVASADSSKNVVKVLDGKPTAIGDGYVTLKMTSAASVNAGRFEYAGVLPNGKVFSGSCELEGIWDAGLDSFYWGIAPVLVASESDTLTGCLRIRPFADSSYAELNNEGNDCIDGGKCGWSAVRRSVYASEDAQLVWSHSESAAAEATEADVEDTATASYVVRLDAFGGLYVSTSSFLALCKETLETNVPSFFAIGDGLVATKYGDFTSWSAKKTGVKLTYTSKTKANAMALVNSSNGYGLTLSFTPSTGVVTGKFKLPMEEGGVSATYKAIVMPGWGTHDCDACGIQQDCVKRPFVSGAAWFDDDASFAVPTKGRSKSKKLAIRRSCPVSVGVSAGM